MEDSIDKISKIKKKYEKTWIAIDGVIGVGIGRTSAGAIGIIVSVKEHSETIRQKIPESVEGVSVEVRFTGDVTIL